MVAGDEKAKARGEFAAQFNEALSGIGAPEGRGRIAWVHKRLRQRGKSLVTQQQIRKYIRGIDIPSNANLWIICDRLQIDWWRFGPTARSEIQNIWRALDQSGRGKLVEYGQFLLEHHRGGPTPET